MKKKEIDAIHKHDLQAFLSSLEIKEAFDEGKLKCNFCGDLITNKNLGGIISKKGQIILACSKLECLAKINES